MKTRVVGIVGSRRRDSEKDYAKTLLLFSRIRLPGDKIVSGSCPRGGDFFAEMIAKKLKIDLYTHLPDKSKLDPRLPYRAAYAKIAYARNGLIAGDADVLIAVVAPDRKGGTEDTISKFCRKYGKSEERLVVEHLLYLIT